MAASPYYVEHWFDGDIIGYCEVEFRAGEEINIETIEFEGKHYLTVLRCTVVSVSNLPIRLLRVKNTSTNVSEEKAYIACGHDVLFTIDETIISDLEEGRSKICAADNHIWVCPK